MVSEDGFLRTPHLGGQDGWTALAPATGGKRLGGVPASRNKLESSCEGSEDKRAGEVLLFTLPPVGRM